MNRTDNSFHVISADGVTAALDGLYIRGGDSTNRGGGVYATASRLTLTNCTISECSATLGEAIYNAGHIRVDACRFEDNRATSVGGALVNAAGSTAEIFNCTFFGNRVERVFLLGGGAMYNGTGSHPLIANTLFMNNRAIGGALGGALYNHNCDPMVINSRFIGNVTENDGGAIANLSDGGGGQSNGPEFVHCTIAYNFALNSGGGMISTGFPPFVINNPRLSNCILWGNVDSGGPDREAQALHPLENAGVTRIEHSCVSGGWPDPSPTTSGLANIVDDPMLTPDGHLRAASPCIDAGAPGFIPFHNVPVDFDGDPRVHNGRVDMGADEFVGADPNGLPDWWVAKFGGGPFSDQDGDGLTAIEEYEITSSNPTAPPVYVDEANGNDQWDGSIPGHVADTPSGPKATLQAGIAAASPGNTVLVAPGEYKGRGNVNLEFGTKALVLRSAAGPQATTIDGEFEQRLSQFNGLTHPATVIDGFTIRKGPADVNGGLLLYSPGAPGTLRSCVLDAAQPLGTRDGVSASQAMIRWFDTELTGGQAEGTVHFVTRSSLEIEEDLVLRNSSLAVSGSTITARGPTMLGGIHMAGDGLPLHGGRLVLADLGQLVVETSINSRGVGLPTRLRCPVSSAPPWGVGEILVRGGAELIVEGTSIIDLGGNSGGTIRIEGALIVRDQATIRNTHLSVILLGLGMDTDIVDNNIRLLDIPGFGGQFFVEEGATIVNNIIVSEGDRYLDFDPDPAQSTGLTISGNRLVVVIKEGVQGEQGALLELRALDHQCAGNSTCPSGAYPALLDSTGFTSENWVLDELEVFENAKLNLTNRQGFVYQSDTQHSETVYVKRLILHPHAVVNTGLQTLYYGEIVDPLGNPLDRNPADPFAELANQSRFQDISVLGFSLIRIDMESDREFGIRVRRRVLDDPELDPEEPSTPAGSIERISTPAGEGVMEMDTHRNGNQEGVGSVVALGSFARASEDKVAIFFDYLFKENPLAELIVSLSDEPHLGGRTLEVARIRPPETGRPGSIGSDQFAMFYGEFAKRDLNFVRGTYVQLELRGTHARIWIDRWDPQITCTEICGDLTDGRTIDDRDYLLELAEYGQRVGPEELDPRSCLDSKTSRDHYVDLDDLLAWDTWLNGEDLNSCGPGDPKLRKAALPVPVTIPPAESLVVAGKTRERGLQTDFLFTVDVEGTCLGNRLSPASAPSSGNHHRSNGRIIQDRSGDLYQIHGTQGLIRLGSSQIVVPPKYFKNFYDDEENCGDVQVGVQITQHGNDYDYFRGFP